MNVAWIDSLLLPGAIICHHSRGDRRPTRLPVVQRTQLFFQTAASKRLYFHNKMPEWCCGRGIAQRPVTLHVFISFIIELQHRCGEPRCYRSVSNHICVKNETAIVFFFFFF